MQSNTLKTLIVTGANKGIGYGIVEQTIRQNLPYKIILCSRDQSRGKSAIDSLLQKYPNWESERLTLGLLDVGNVQSRKDFKEWFKQAFGTVDVLWSNAAVFYTQGPFTYDRLVETWEVNFDGTISLFDEMNELINDGGKALFMSSNGGLMAYKNCSETVQKRIVNANSLEDIKSARQEFFDYARNGKAGENGWREHAYGMSKAFLNIYGAQLAKTDSVKKRKIFVATVHPGFVSTDMTSTMESTPDLSVDEGCETPMFVMQQEFNEASNGKYWSNKQITAFP